MAAHHRVLMVGDQGVLLYAGSSRTEVNKPAGIGREAAVSWEAPDFEAQLRRALGDRRDDVVVLFNEADHSYRKEENIPAADRQRRLDAAFPGLPNRAALEIFLRPEEGRADPALHSYLMVGLPETGHLRQLGGALSGAGVSVAGSGVLPVEATGLVDALADKVFPNAAAGKKARWSMLAGQHETGGLRQVIVKDGNLALTRMIDVPTVEKSDGPAWARTVLEEAKAAIVYLRRFGYTDDQGLNVMILCGAAEKPLFGPNALARTALSSLTLPEALAHLGVVGQDGGGYVGQDCVGFAEQDGVGFADALYAAWTERNERLKLDLAVPLLAGKDGTRH